MSRLLFVHGDKGGTGKSTVANLYLDARLHDGRTDKLVVVDADRRNPDTFRVFDQILPCYRLNLTRDAGWDHLGQLIIQDPQDRDIVVVLPSQIGGFIKQQWDDGFGQGLRDAQCPLTLLWVLDRSPDAIALLRAAMTDLKANLDDLLVIKNGLWGDPDEFTLWDASQVRQDALTLGCERDLPRLRASLAAKVKLFREPYSQGLTTHGLTLIERSQLQQWLSRCRPIFSPLDTHESDTHSGEHDDGLA